MASQGEVSAQRSVLVQLSVSPEVAYELLSSLCFFLRAFLPGS